MGLFCDTLLELVRRLELEAWTPALQDTTHSLFSTKVFLFSICNLYLDKSDEENKMCIFKAWAESKTSYMASL